MKAIQNLLKPLPFVTPIAVVFYTPHFWSRIIPNEFLFILFFLPCVVFLASALYGAFHGFTLSFSLLVVLLFLPAVFLVYGKSALVYAMIYFTVSITGNLLGLIFRRQKPKQEK